MNSDTTFRSLFLLSIMFMLLASGFSNAAEMPFAGEELIDGSFDGASSVITVDVDLDGDLDVVGTARWANAVAWWENPSWTQHTVASDFIDAYQVCSADFNGDGWPDLAGAARLATGSNLRWWANPGDGGGAWTETNVSSAYLSKAFSVDAGDLDGDGHVDLVVGGYHDSVQGVFMWFRNTGTGASFNWFDIGTGYGTPHSVQVADIDDDQLLDVVGTTYAGDQVLWFRNDGSIISLDHWPEYVIRTAVDGAISARAGDLDQDGDLDVAVAAYEDGDILWYENSGASPPTWSQHTVNSSFAGAFSVFPVDMDLDGDLDLLASARVDNAIHWWERVGSSWYEHVLDATVAWARAAVAVDLDEDGDPDVVGAAEDTDDILWWENLMVHRESRYSTTVDVATTSAPFTAAATLDADRDGKLDIVVTSDNDDGGDDVILFTQGSLGSIWDRHSLETGLAGVASVHVADLNSDHLPDLVVAATDDNTIAWYRAYASGVFSRGTISTGFTGVSDAITADVDLDGDLDVIGSAESIGNISWWENALGTATPWTRHDVSSMAAPSALAAGDLDGDFDMDVVAVGDASNSLRWFENLGVSGGSVSWTPHTLSAILSNPRAVLVADFTGDHRLDIVAANSTDSPQLRMWRNLGGSPPTWDVLIIDGPSASSDGVADLEAVDVDLDGDLDIVGVLAGDEQVIQWRNFFGDGSGWPWNNIAFTSSITTPRAVTAGDVDRDGDPDPVFVGDSKAAWKYNKGGQFSLVTIDESSASVVEGSNALLFTIIPIHLGRAGDLNLEMEWLNLRFEDAAGDPLADADINDLIERLYLFFDSNDSGNFEWGLDSLLVVDGTITTVSPGYMQLPVPHGQVNPSITPGGSIDFYLVAEIAEGAASATPSCFRITNSAGGTVTPLRYELYDMDPRPAYYSSVESGLICAVATLFADDFETGNLSAWSSHAP